MTCGGEKSALGLVRPVRHVTHRASRLLILSASDELRDQSDVNVGQCELTVGRSMGLAKMRGKHADDRPIMSTHRGDAGITPPSLTLGALGSGAYVPLAVARLHGPRPQWDCANRGIGTVTGGKDEEALGSHTALRGHCSKTVGSGCDKRF